MSGAAEGRKAMSMHLLNERRQQLEEIVAHHYKNGRDYMSMTRVLETLIDREHRRLKLGEQDASV